jgi:hypothetical protein
VVVVVIALLLGWLGSRKPSSGPENNPTPQQIPPPGLTDKQATDMVAAAKRQIDKKDYLAAQSTLSILTQRLPSTSPQGSEARDLLKKVSPLAAKEAERQRKAEELKQAYRNGARATLERSLLSAGYDVRVGFVGAEGATTSTNLLIMGEPVNRVFIHQLIGPGLRRSLQRDGFTKVTFMKSRWEWVGEYDVATDTITDMP